MKKSKAWVLVRHYLQKSQRDMIFTHASALAYVSILSLIPLLAMAYFAFSTFGGFEKLQGNIEDLVAQNLAPSFGGQILIYIESVRTGLSAKALGTFGLLGFAYTSISMLGKIEEALNQVWGIRESRAWDKKILNYWALLTLGPMFLGVSLLLSTQALTWLKHDGGEISKLLVLSSTIIPYLVSGGFISAIFILLPNTQVHKREAIVAGLITGLAFEIAKHAYSFYAMKALGKSIYGSLAVLPVFILWLYIIWVLILLGAQLAYYLELRRIHADFAHRATSRINWLLSLDLIEQFVFHAKKGQSGMTLQEILRIVRVGRADLLDHLQDLVKKGILLESKLSRRSDIKYFLSMDSQAVSGEIIAQNLMRGIYQPHSEKTMGLYQKLVSSLKEWKWA